ncbi:MAG: hypothetical protein HW400_224 [Candidatus Levybacteria bacterium]|nr:hypothetical protein [Candidatus Levybacteria bacterium]
MEAGKDPKGNNTPEKKQNLVSKLLNVGEGKHQLGIDKKSAKVADFIADSMIDLPKNPTVGRIGLSALALTGMSVVAYEGIPAVHQAVYQAVEQFRHIDTTTTSFDISKNYGVINSNNSIIIDLNAIEQIKTENLLAPIKGPVSGQINYEKRSIGTRNDPAVPKDIRFYNADVNNVKDTITFYDYPENKEIPASADGYIIFVRIGQNLPEGLVNAARILYNAPDGAPRITTIDATGKLLVPLIPAEAFTGDPSQIDRIKIPVKRGQDILKTTAKSNINMSTLGLPSSSSPASQAFPVEANLMVTPNPSTHDLKVTIVK